MTIHAIDTPAAISTRPFVTKTILACLARWAHRLWSFHDIRRELGALSDDVLKDVGLCRCGIDFVAGQLADDHASPVADSRAVMSKRK
jgi:uncharacterized protein YjiS (DUF1127 family)